MSKTYIIDTLRAHLKARDLTYKDLADGLELSEVSVKRLFTGADIGLDRLEQICQFLQIELSDLFKTSPKKRKLISRLTQAQEAEFAKNNKLLMVTATSTTASRAHWRWPSGSRTKSSRCAALWAGRGVVRPSKSC